jgi:hypothetical protein
MGLKFFRLLTNRLLEGFLTVTFWYPAAVAAGRG